jgi:hypothetical protein
MPEPRVLCPECYLRIGGEEKTCGHMLSRPCTECGRDKRDGEDPGAWSCVGTLQRQGDPK